MVDKLPKDILPGSASRGSVVHASDAAVSDLSRSHKEEDISRLQSAANPYNALLTYGVGDLVEESGIVYRNITPIAIPESFNPTNWNAIGSSPNAVLNNQANTYTGGGTQNFGNSNFTNVGTLNTNTIPPGTDTFAMLGATQTFTGDNIFREDVNIIKNDNTAAFLTLTTYDDFQGGGIFQGRRARGTETSPDEVESNDTLVNFVGIGYNGTSFVQGGLLEFNATGTWTNSSHPTRLDIVVTDVGSTSLEAVLTILPDGTADFFNNNLINVESLGIRDSDDSNTYTILGGALTGDFDVTIPSITANDTFAMLGAIQTFTQLNTFTGGIHNINGTGAATYIARSFSDGQNPSSFDGFKARGTESSPDPVENNDVLLTIIARGQDDTSAVIGARVDFTAAATWSGINHATKIEFFNTNTTGPEVKRLEIAPDGTFNFQNNEMSNVGKVIIEGSASANLTQTEIYGNASIGMRLTIPNGTNYSLSIGNTAIYSFNSTEFDLFGNNIRGIGYLETDAITTPSTPSNGNGRYYTKEVATVTTPFFIGDNGIEINLSAVNGSLDDLSDVTITPTTINDILVSDVEGAWVNRQGVFTGITGFGILSQDVNVGTNNITNFGFLASTDSSTNTLTTLALGVGQAIGWRNNADDANAIIGFNSSDEMVIDVPIGASTVLTINAAEEYHFNATRADWNNNGLINVEFIGLRDSDDSNSFTIIGGALTGNFDVTIPTITTNDTFALVGVANSWGAFDQNISATGEWQEAGVPISPIGKHSEYIRANDMYPNVTLPALDVVFESATNLINVQAITFLAAVNNFASFTWAPPPEWDAGTVTVKLYWSSPNGTATQDVEFLITSNAYSQGDITDIAYPATTSVIDELTAILTVEITGDSPPITIGNTPAKGDIVVFQIERDALAGSDTLTGAVRLAGIEIIYTTDAANSE